MNTVPGPEHPVAEQLHALRRNGGWRVDPARFHYLEALARRADAQREPVRKLLEAKLLAGIAEFAARVSDGRVAGEPAPRRATRETPASPLADLNRALRKARPDADPARDDELASVRRFRAAWDAQRAIEKLDRALAQKPAQPGPLNSHALLLQSLEAMRSLSPDYLRHFLLHAETLLWLASGGEKGEQPAAKRDSAPRRVARARPKK